MVEIKGILHFDPVNISKKHKKQSSWKKVAMVKFEDETDLLYSWFLKKRFNLELNRPMRGAHVTIISDIVDDVIWEEARKAFHGKEITLKYDVSPKSNGEHWWLKVESKDAENIRVAMGLSAVPYFNYHLTIGYAADRIDSDGNSMGGSNLEHSKYILEQCKRFNL